LATKIASPSEASPVIATSGVPTVMPALQLAATVGPVPAPCVPVVEQLETSALFVAVS
jgi:hypothetical protein